MLGLRCVPPNGEVNARLLHHGLITVAAGDNVKMEMSPYDLEKARITFRMKEANPLPRPPMRRRY